MSQSFLALLSKLQGKKCLTHVDTKGQATAITLSSTSAREVRQSGCFGLIINKPNSKRAARLLLMTAPRTSAAPRGRAGRVVATGVFKLVFSLERR
jgi:hypothetical protein